MFSLQSRKILYKLLLLVAVLLLVIAVAGCVGFYGIRHLVQDTSDIASVGKRALTGVPANQNILDLTQAVFRIAANPSADNIAEVQKIIDANQQIFRKRVAALKTTANDAELAQLKEIEAANDRYISSLQVALETAKQTVSQAVTSDRQRKLLDVANASHIKSEAVSNAIYAYAAFVSDLSDDTSKRAIDNAAAIQRIMILIVGIGVLGSATFGYLFGALAIVRPIATATQSSSELSAGGTKPEMLGVGHCDEVGKIADNMRVLNENLIRNQNMQAREAEAQAAKAKRSIQIAELIGC